MRKFIFVFAVTAALLVAKGEQGFTAGSQDLPTIEIRQINGKGVLRFNGQDGKRIYRSMIRAFRNSAVQLANGSFGCFTEEFEGDLGQVETRRYCAIRNQRANGFYASQTGFTSSQIFTFNEVASVVLRDRMRRSRHPEHVLAMPPLGSRRSCVGGGSTSRNCSDVAADVPLISWTSRSLPNMICASTEAIQAGYPQPDGVYERCFLSVVDDFSIEPFTNSIRSSQNVGLLKDSQGTSFQDNFPTDNYVVFERGQTRVEGFRLDTYRGRAYLQEYATGSRLSEIQDFVRDGQRGDGNNRFVYVFNPRVTQVRLVDVNGVSNTNHGITCEFTEGGTFENDRVLLSCTNNGPDVRITRDEFGNFAAQMHVDFEYANVIGL